MSERRLSDADVEAVAEAIREKMIEQFYQDLGKGLWGWMKRGLITLAMILAAYGAYKGGHQ